MTDLNFTVHPQFYFEDHYRNTRVSTQNERMSIKVTQPLLQWVDYVRKVVPDETEPKTICASSALEFGTTRPEIEWGIDPHLLSNIDTEVRRLEMEGEVYNGEILAQMDTSHAHATIDTPLWVHFSPDTIRCIDIYSSVLRVGKPCVMRHCMAISFYYYSASVVDGERLVSARGKIEPYVISFERQLNRVLNNAEVHGVI